jgi:hypothetical protein
MPRARRAAELDERRHSHHGRPGRRIIAGRLRAFSLKRDPAFARGAAATATLLALIGVAGHYDGVQFTFFTAVLRGPPVA